MPPEDEASVDTTELEATKEENNALPSTEETAVEDVKVQQEEEESDDEDEEDPITKFQREFREVELTKLREELAAEARETERQRIEAERQQLALQQRQETLQNSFGNTVKATRDVVAKELVPFLRDEDGEQIKLTDELFQNLLDTSQAYNSSVSEAEQLQVYTQLANAALNTLAESQRDEFKKRASNKPLDEYLKIHAELAVTETSTYKKLKEEMAIAVQAAEARGYAKGSKQFKGTPPAAPPNEVPNTRETYRTDNLVDAAKALAAGQITPERYAEIHRSLRR